MGGNIKHNTFETRDTMQTSKGRVVFYNLQRLAQSYGAVEKLPISLKILLEGLLRLEDGLGYTQEHVHAVLNCADNPKFSEIPFAPSRVLLQDFTGVPAVVDLAAMRSALAQMGKDPGLINPQIPVDLVIDHSVSVDAFGTADALSQNSAIEFERNKERYQFLRWGQKAFDNFRVIPPESGICHQVNLEYLADVAAIKKVGDTLVAQPDSLVGTDSHTTMINGLGVLGWGVGGIEAEAAMLGQPLSMLLPEVVGFELVGELPPGTTATDLVLTVTEQLRAKGVVGKFVEFFGDGLSSMSVPNRATLANMAPEYGATMGYFPVDDLTLTFLKQTGRSVEQVALVEQYFKAQGLFRTAEVTPHFSSTVTLDLSQVEPSVAGPKRPQDRVSLTQVKTSFSNSLTAPVEKMGYGLSSAEVNHTVNITLDSGQSVELSHGAVVVAAITSCTNTSNPAVMLAAGLLAQKAVAAGLTTKPWVKTSLAPGSKVVTEYLDAAGLTPALEALGFYTVGYGCTTCIGNSGPLPGPLKSAVETEGLLAASVLSGNRNFEGRVNPLVKPSYLASPPLVVAYALVGSVKIDLTSEPLGIGHSGQPVFLKDIWPTQKEVDEVMGRALDPALFQQKYGDLDNVSSRWNGIDTPSGTLFEWSKQSTYIQHPPFFDGMAMEPEAIKPFDNARVLAKLGDSITTDHISPAGAIAPGSPAALYLEQQGVEQKQWNSFGSRRGNDRVMTRGTFGNIRLKNQLAPGTEGSFTTHFPSGDITSIYDAANRYNAAAIPHIVLAGSDYGMGSSRDWAAKGTYLLGVRAVIAKSFERIHRSNLVGMGVLPLQFEAGQDAAALNLQGNELFSVAIDDALKPGQNVTVTAQKADGSKITFTTKCRIDTPIEITYYRNGGILHTVLRGLAGR